MTVATALKKQPLAGSSSQDTNLDPTAYVSTNMKKLFRFEALDAGESIQRKIKVSISRIQYPQGDFEDYGSFSVGETPFGFG